MYSLSALLRLLENLIPLASFSPFFTCVSSASWSEDSPTFFYFFPLYSCGFPPISCLFNPISVSVFRKIHNDMEGVPASPHTYQTLKLVLTLHPFSPVSSLLGLPFLADRPWVRDILVLPDKCPNSESQRVWVEFFPPQKAHSFFLQIVSLRACGSANKGETSLCLLMVHMSCYILS